jgi:hypothetical protein
MELIYLVLTMPFKNTSNVRPTPMKVGKDNIKAFEVFLGSLRIIH